MNVIEFEKEFEVEVALERVYTVRIKAESANMASAIAANYVQKHYKELTPDQEMPEVTTASAIGIGEIKNA